MCKGQHPYLVVHLRTGKNSEAVGALVQEQRAAASWAPHSSSSAREIHGQLQ